MRDQFEPLQDSHYSLIQHFHVLISISFIPIRNFHNIIFPTDIMMKIRFRTVDHLHELTILE